MEDKPVFGIIQILASVPNFGVLLSSRNKTANEALKFSTLVMNIIVCLSIGIDAVLSGKTYIQYAWFLAALISTIALVIQLKKGRTATA